MASMAMLNNQRVYGIPNDLSGSFHKSYQNVNLPGWHRMLGKKHMLGRSKNIGRR